MKITRRHFVKTSAAVMLTTGLLGVGQSANAQTTIPDLFPIPPESTMDPLNYLTSKHFTPFVDSIMTAQGNEGRAVNVRLKEVSEITLPENVNQGYTGECYSLLFEPGRKVKMPADTYRFQHPSLGEFSLTILPVGLSGTVREAIVNRIARPY